MLKIYCLISEIIIIILLILLNYDKYRNYIYFELIDHFEKKNESLKF